LSLVVDEHRQYLADHARLSAFRQAIGEVVKPGDVVLDLGSGTGILGLLACRAGAKRVYSIEQGGMIELARQVSRANGFQDQMVFIKGLSTRVHLPEQVDVILADQIGRFGFEAGLLEYFSDARTRFLKASGVMIPSHVDLCVVPVECPDVWGQIEFWNDSPAGFDFSPARSLAANTGYPVKFRPEHFLGDPVTRLSDSVMMSNSPLTAQPINRMNVFFPIDRPVPLTQGERVQISMHIVPTELLVTWKVAVWGDTDHRQGEARGIKKAGFTHSTFQGMLISKEDLQRTQPHFLPKLSSWGEARLSVLSLCDGQRALSAIEQEVYHRHPTLFRSCGDAAAFVAEVITRYSV
jgi:ribosomal protein L11 methyltransferase PrmA